MLDFLKYKRRSEIVFFNVTAKMNVIVRNGFAENAEVIQPDENGRYFLKRGVYSFDVFGEELCAVHKVFVVKKENLGEQICIELPEIPFTNKESEYKGPVFLFTDELEKKLYDIENLNEIDESIFDTPAFEPGKAVNQFTTNDEKKEYLRKILKNCDYAYMDETTYPFPVVFFAKEVLKKGMTDQEIFDAMHENHKLNLFYHAQLHGTETPAGEGALTIAKKLTGEFGEKILDKMNIVLVPCVNQKGNAEIVREKDGIDLNRDFLRTSTKEIQELHRIFYKLMPEVTVDGHTWTRANLFQKNDLRRTLFDVRISAANSLNMDESLAEIDEEMTLFAQNECRKAGFRTGYYGAGINRSHSKTYYSLSPCCSIVFECEGTRSAKYHFKRNVWAQHKGITSIFQYVYEHSELIQEKVNCVRENVKAGKYIHDGKFVIKQKRSGTKKYVNYIDNYDFYGRLVKKNAKVCYYKFDIPIKVLQTPTAFIIEKKEMEEKWISFFKEIHGVCSEEKILEKDLNMISLKGKEDVCLKKGTEVYWFPCDQLQVQVMEALFVESYREFEVKKEDGIYAYYE